MGAKFSISTEGSKTLTSGSTKGLLGIIGTTGITSSLIEFGISFSGTVSVDTPVLVELVQATIVSGTTAATPTKVAWSRNAATSACAVYSVFTAEPSYGSRLGSWYVHPQGGNLVIQYPLGREPVISDGTAAGIVLRYTTSTGVAPGCVAYMVWEE